MLNTDYEYIYKILECGNITEAARKLYISQSALSQYIKRLETKIGHTIFDRDIFPLRLTEVGEIYYCSLKEMEKIEDDTIKKIQDLENLKSGTLNICATDYIIYYLLPQVIKEFNKLYPGIKVKLYEGKINELNHRTLLGECDFTVSYNIPDFEEIENINLYQEEVYVSIPQKHPLVEKLNLEYPQKNNFPIIDAKLLKNNKIIRAKRGQNLSLIYYELDKFTDNTLETVLQTDNMNLANKYVSEGFGITLIPSFMIENSNLDCVYVKTNPPLSKRTIMINYNKQRRLKKIAKIFIDLLKNFNIDKYH